MVLVHSSSKLLRLFLLSVFYLYTGTLMDFPRSLVQSLSLDPSSCYFRVGKRHNVVRPTYGQKTSLSSQHHPNLDRKRPLLAPFLPFRARTRTTIIEVGVETKAPPSWELYAKKKKSKSAGPPTANHEKWQPYFDQLSKYKDQHGTCEVNEVDDPSLYHWYQDQLKSYQALQVGRKTKLTRKRAVALEQIGAIPVNIMDGDI